jgi:hypothetical protein
MEKYTLPVSVANIFSAKCSHRKQHMQLNKINVGDSQNDIILLKVKFHTLLATPNKFIQISAIYAKKK